MDRLGCLITFNFDRCPYLSCFMLRSSSFKHDGAQNTSGLAVQLAVQTVDALRRNMSTSFGQWLKQRRRALDLTQAALAQQVWCSPETLRKFESGQRRPSREMAQLLAEKLYILSEEQSGFIQFARTGQTDTVFHPAPVRFRQPNNLPIPSTPLIGRGDDVANAIRQLSRETTRLLTLLGPPGIGKTRLSIAIAHQMLDDFADGVFFVAFAPISDPTLVPATIANALGLQEMGPLTSLERLKGHLHEKQILLVLDNFEQIVTAAPCIADLLSASSWLKILVTSRAPLRIRYERQFPVSPLALPDLANLPDAETIARYSAVTLFTERVQAVKPDFSLTPQNASTVAAICTQLDGLPLAIELISARVKLLPPVALLERLHGRLMLQSDGLRDLEPRHQTLNAAIDWSYQLLNAEEQTLFRRLGVFVGGCTLEAIEVVCSPSMDMLNDIASLVDKNLLRQETDFDGEPRFTLLETLREYAMARLIESGEEGVLRQAHASYYLALAERAEPELRLRQHYRWFQLLEMEQDNLRAVFEWSLGSGDVTFGVQLAGALGSFWFGYGHHVEAHQWTQRLFTRLDDVPMMYHAKFLISAGRMAEVYHDLETAKQLFMQARTISHSLEDRFHAAWTLAYLGLTLFTLSVEAKQATTVTEEGLSLFRELNYQPGIAHTLNIVGMIAHLDGDYARAKHAFEEALTAAQQTGDTRQIAIMYSNLAIVAQHEGDHEHAKRLLRQGLLRHERHNDLDTATDLAFLAGSMSATGQPEQAARLLGASEAAYERLGAFYQPGDQLEIDQIIAAVCSQLDAAAFEAAWAAGRSLTLERATTFALEQTGNLPEGS